MKQLFAAFKRKLGLVRGLFPMKLPKSVEEFNKFYQMLLDTYGFPDFPSYRQTVATIVMHLPPTTASKAPLFFAKSIHKGMANQISYEQIQAIQEADRAKKAAAAKAEQEAQTQKLLTKNQDAATSTTITNVEGHAAIHESSPHQEVQSASEGLVR